MKFNEKLIELRKKEGLSQEELGYKLNVTRQTISKWELGQTTPEMDKIVAMSKIFNMSVDELIKEEETEFNKKSIMEEQPIQKENIKSNKKIIAIIVGIVIIILIVVIGKTLVTNHTLDKFFDMFNKSKQAQENQVSSVLNKATGIIDQVTQEQQNSISQTEMANEFLSMFDKGTNTIETSDENYKETEKNIAIAKFNGGIEIFSGTNSGVNVKHLLDKIITSNQTKAQKITVQYKETETQDETEIKDIKQKMENLNDYEVIFQYDADGFINRVRIV